MRPVEILGRYRKAFAYRERAAATQRL